MTTSLQIESRVGKDGILTLHVPLAPSDAGAEVIVTIRPKLPDASDADGSNWPPGYFDKTYGSLADNPLDVPEDPIPAPGETD
jgi:hypothetical protein